MPFTISLLCSEFFCVATSVVAGCQAAPSMLLERLLPACNWVAAQFSTASRRPDQSAGTHQQMPQHVADATDARGVLLCEVPHSKTFVLATSDAGSESVHDCCQRPLAGSAKGEPARVGATALISCGVGTNGASQVTSNAARRLMGRCERVAAWDQPCVLRCVVFWPRFVILTRMSELSWRPTKCWAEAVWTREARFLVDGLAALSICPKYTLLIDREERPSTI